MITITLIQVARDQSYVDDFLRSLSYSNSGENPYEVVSEKDSGIFAQNNIARVTAPSEGSRVNITLPNNCIVLGNSWDKYIIHALDNGLPKGGVGRELVDWPGYVKMKMNLTSRDQSGVFPEMKVELATG